MEKLTLTDFRNENRRLCMLEALFKRLAADDPIIVDGCKCNYRNIDIRFTDIKMPRKFCGECTLPNVEGPIREHCTVLVTHMSGRYPD